MKDNSQILADVAEMRRMLMEEKVSPPFVLYLPETIILNCRNKTNKEVFANQLSELLVENKIADVRVEVI